MRKKTAFALASASAAIFVSGPALAGGFALEQQNAEALGAAFAGAQAKSADPGFAAYNPAAIGGIAGFDLSVNATGVFTSTRFESARGALFGVAPISGATTGEGFGKPALIPNLSLAAPIGERVTVGIVVNSYFGLKTDFDANSVIRYQARESEALSLAATPIIAVELGEGLTIAAGPRIQYLDLSVTATIDAGGIAGANGFPGFLPGSSDLPASFNGNDVALGFVAGFQATLGESLTIGGAYASRIAHDIKGEAEFALAQSPAAQGLNLVAGLFAPTDFVSDFDTPATAGLGLRFEASERLALLASTTYTRWTAFEEVALVFANPAQPPEILRQEWNDGWTLSVGGEYSLAETTAMRAGFMFDQTPVKDAFASPRIPDADRYWATLGVSQEVSERLSADFGFAVAFFESRPIALAGVSPEAILRGSLSADLETTAYAVSGRLRYRF
jgi:long-chain fatty acid transport protein